MICTKCQSLFSGKNKKDISEWLPEILPSMQIVNYKKAYKFDHFSLEAKENRCIYMLHFRRPVDVDNCYINKL